jgi:hypothetical protein
MTCNFEIKAQIPPKPLKITEIKVHISLHQPKKPEIKVRVCLQPPKKPEHELPTPPQPQKEPEFCVIPLVMFLAITVPGSLLLGHSYQPFKPQNIETPHDD